MRRVVMTCLAVSVMSAVGCSNGPQMPPFKPVVDNRTLMNSVIEKQANVVWDSVGTVVTPEGTQERRPQTDEDWANLRDAAVTLTESGNLLMLTPRAHDGDEWMKAAAGMVEQGERMISAVARKSPEQVFDVGATLYDSCVRCHMNYMPGVAEMYR